MEYKKLLLSLDYESQHFNIHPRTFNDIVYNLFWEHLVSSLNSFKKLLMREYNDVVAPSCINVLTDELLQMYTTKLDKCIDKLEIYVIENLMHIPPKVVLPEDRAHILTPCTKEEDENIDREIEELRRKIMEEKAKRHNLKQIISEQNQVIKRLQYLRNEIEQLLKTASEMGVTKENIETLYSNLEKLVSVIPVNGEK